MQPLLPYLQLTHPNVRCFANLFLKNKPIGYWMMIFLDWHLYLALFPSSSPPPSLCNLPEHTFCGSRWYILLPVACPWRTVPTAESAPVGREERTLCLPATDRPYVTRSCWFIGAAEKKAREWVGSVGSQWQKTFVLRPTEKAPGKPDGQQIADCFNYVPGKIMLERPLFLLSWKEAMIFLHGHPLRTWQGSSRAEEKLTCKWLAEWGAVI